MRSTWTCPENVEAKEWESEYTTKVNCIVGELEG